MLYIYNLLPKLFRLLFLQKMLFELKFMVLLSVVIFDEGTNLFRNRQLFLKQKIPNFFSLLVTLRLLQCKSCDLGLFQSMVLVVAKFPSETHSFRVYKETNVWERCDMQVLYQYKTPAKHRDIFRSKCNASARFRTHDLVSARQTHY